MDLPTRDPITDEMIASIVAIAADAIICVDDSQRITFFNDGAEQIFGYTPAEILGRPIEVLIPRQFRTGHHSQVEEFGHSEIRARRMGERGSIWGLRKNGEEFPAEAAISHIPSPNGEVYSVVLRDITQRRRAEDAQRFLAEAGEILASSLGSDETVANVARLAVPKLADACIVNVYHGGGFHGVAVAHADPELERRLRKSRTEHPLDPEAVHSVAHVIRTGKPLILADLGATSSNLGSGVPLDIFDGKPAVGAVFLPMIARDQLIGVIALYTHTRRLDVDELRLAEDLARRGALALDNARLHDQVRLGLQARDDMIGIVSHDLRNPVHAVKMLTGAILGEKDTPPSPQVVEYSEVIRQAAEQMDSLIQDLLDVTRVEAGRLSVDLLPVDTGTLLEESLRTLEPVAESKSIRLRLDAASDLPAVVADGERIAQALSNLVGNAVKFSPAGNEVTVKAAERDGDVIVSVADNGPGMTPDQLAHAFDRFWQSRRTDREGAGLGLAITKGIIDAHGGRIWAESEVGRGSTFHFTLPVATLDTD
jgi:PAS domain S-box-containing protein